MKEFKNNSDTLDQHFLIDQKVIDNFIKVCDLNKEDIVLEVGPGKGTLTKIISNKVSKMYAIEKDIRLIKYLNDIPNVIFKYEDVLKSKLPKVDKIITALPYSIIEPFIYKLIYSDFKKVYMIMGSNYVDSVINKKITNLSVLTNSFYDVKKYFEITPDAFDIKPRTLSAVISLEPKKVLTKQDLIMQCMYHLDDKKVQNALRDAYMRVYNLTKKEAKEKVLSLNINPDILGKVFSEINNTELKEIYERI